MPIKVKKYFKELFIYHDAYYVIKIKFNKPIVYNQYYALTKIVCCSLLPFQTAPYLDTFSYDFVTIEETCPFEPTYIVDISNDIFKKILLNIKQELNNFYQTNLLKYVHMPRCEAINKHIEELVVRHDACKKMSVRQLNSSNNRKVIKYNQKISSAQIDDSNSVVNTSQAIDYLLNQIIKLCMNTEF